MTSSGKGGVAGAPASPPKPTPTRMDTALRFHRAGELAKAERIYRDVVRAQPTHFDALNMLGLIALQRGDAADAVRLIDRAIAQNGTIGQAWTTRGMALAKLGRLTDALASFDRAIALHPGLADAFGYRGGVLLALRRYHEALQSLDQALKLRPEFGIVLLNRALTLLHLERRTEALDPINKLLRIAPDFPYALGLLQRLQSELCDWAGFDDRTRSIEGAVTAGRTADVPFQFLMISGRPADQFACARAYAADLHPASPEPLWRGERYRHERIRIAYISADFREHAVARLIAELIELHDRRRFEIIGVSLGSATPSPMRDRLQRSFDRFLDASPHHDRNVAETLRQLEVDIAVDLMGYTHGCRPGILACRPAPVQVNYLGYPGTMGAPYVDYIVADRTLVPEGDDAAYSEKVIRLPEAYQPNDRRRGLPPPATDRAAEGLPESAFVFCCFNNQFKLSPTIFAVWMRLLRSLPDSVLWLLDSNPDAVANLRREAERAGVEARRVVFAARVSASAHLARHALADLFLDTLPYGAHTTASDALWTGLPLLTCRGTAFPGRVAASLLTAAGLPEMIVEDLEAYEALALRLATDRSRLAAMRAKLVANRSSCPLFDTDRYRQHLEVAFATMWRRAEDGLAPEAFAVPPLPKAI